MAYAGQQSWDLSMHVWLGAHLNVVDVECFALDYEHVDD